MARPGVGATSALVTWTLVAAATWAQAGGEVSCGGHSAPHCGDCPRGQGPSWCNGDCGWSGGRCVPKAEAESSGDAAAAKEQGPRRVAIHGMSMPGGPVFMSGGPRVIALRPGTGLDHIDPLGLMLGNLGQIVASRPPGQMMVSAAPGRFAGALPAPPGMGLPGHPLQPLMSPMQSLLDAMGDASGHLGEASDFNVSNVEDLFQITANLPGHKLDQDGRGSDPLAVRVVERHVVIKGRHVKGPVTFEFQRSFNLPPRANVSAISVDYSTTSGKLVISIPKRPRLEGEEDDVPDAPEEGALPATPFADLQRSLSQFFGEGARLSGQGNLRRSVAPPDHQQVQELFSHVVEKPHRARTISARVQEDNVTYLGCFGSEELPGEKSELEAPATDHFAALRRAAEARLGPEDPTQLEGARFFAAALPAPASRSAGAAFAFSAVPHMPPAFGTERCGHRCRYAAGQVEERWCGCSPSEEVSEDCPHAAGGRFAVYLLPREDGSRASLPRSRPVWHLGADADGTPTLEVHAPPGRKLKQDAGRLFVVKDDRPDGPGGGGEKGGDVPLERSAPAEAKEPEAADRLAHVGVPVDLSEHECAMSEGGGELKCRLKEERVKEIPVHYTKDEL